MKSTPIRLGQISLQDFEVPPSVRFGGRHRLAVHYLADGSRVVERLGPDESEITFQGTSSGPNAEDRVRAFDSLRLSGEAVWLTWQSFRQKVIVRNFVADYHSPAWIPFKISCTVIKPEGLQTTSTSASRESVLADLASAVLATSGSPIQLTALQAALSRKNALVDGTQDHSLAIAAVAGCLDAADAQITQQTATVTAGIPIVTSQRQLRTLFNATVASAGSLAAAVNAKSYIGRIGVNVSGLS